MCSSFKLLPLDSYEVIAWFGYFYVVLSAFEKRCRDLRMQGFWVTLIVTAFHLSLIPRVDKAVPNCFPVFSDIIFYVYIALLFSWCPCPVKMPRKNLRSILCWNTPMYILPYVVRYILQGKILLSKFAERIYDLSVTLSAWAGRFRHCPAFGLGEGCSEQLIPLASASGSLWKYVWKKHLFAVFAGAGFLVFSFAVFFWE